MSNIPDCRNVRTELGVRVSCSPEEGRLAEILTSIREAGASLDAHLVYRTPDHVLLYFVCAQPSDAALALMEQGMDAVTETVLVVETDNHPGAFGHLVKSLENEAVVIEYSYASCISEELFVVIRTAVLPSRFVDGPGLRRLAFCGVGCVEIFVAIISAVVVVIDHGRALRQLANLEQLLAHRLRDVLQPRTELGICAADGAHDVR